MRTAKNIFVYLMLGMALHGISQGLLNNGAVITFSGSAQMYINGTNGHYTSQSTGSISPSATSTLTLLGNWVNNSSNTGFASDQGFLRMLGTSQTIGGSSATAFYNLSLSGTNTSLAVNSTTVGGQATFTGVLAVGTGTLNLNGNLLNVTNGAIGAITSGATGYIISETNAAVNPSIVRWYVRNTTGSHVYPFGVAGQKIPFTFNITGAMAAGNYVDVSTRATTSNNNLPWAGASEVGPVLEMFSPNGPFIDGSDEVVIDRWWNISPSSTPTANITFTYRGIENTMASPYDVGNIGAQYWTGTGWALDNSNYGTAAAVSGAGVTGSLTATGISKFCPWVLSSRIAPLPIELLNFEADCDNSETILRWCTASELNNHYFAIEQSSDGSNFQDIAYLNGNGTTSQKHCYQYNVNSSIASVNYFRLRQTDFDNKYTYSKIISIEACDKKIDNMIITNNGSHVVGLLVNSSGDSRFDLNINDAVGQIIMVKHIEIKTGFNSIPLDLENLANGIYYISSDNNIQKVVRKKIVLSY